jgi:hypothetical protein
MYDLDFNNVRDNITIHFSLQFAITPSNRNTRGANYIATCEGSTSATQDKKEKRREDYDYGHLKKEKRLSMLWLDKRRQL